MERWWIDLVAPGVVSVGIVGAVGYVKLHFERKWPFWGRQEGRSK